MRVEPAANSRSLKSLFLDPRSVAFIGVPRNSGPGSLNPVDHLRNWGYEGDIHLIHPHVSEIAGLPVVKNIASVNGNVDLAVISTPRETVPEMIKECGLKGIRAVVVTNQGFAEADARGSELQRAMLDEARQGGVRILGPNTLGVSNAFDRFTSSFMPLDREELPIGLICQSGVFFVGASHLVGGMGLGVDIGNACDLDLADALEWLGTDPRMRVLAVHAEGITRGRRFLEIAKQVCTRIPVVLLKTGRSPEGARAAASHSGSMVGEDAVVGAVAAKSGMIRVTETQEMCDLVRGFVRLPPMSGPRVAIVTLTGAGGILLLDSISAWGLEAARLSSTTLERVQSLAPSWMPLSNPMDIWPALMKHGMRKVYGMALEDVLRDPNVDGVLCVALGLPRSEQAHLGAVEVIQEASKHTEKPVVVWFYGSRIEEARAQLESDGSATAVHSLEQGVRLLARMAQYERWKSTRSGCKT